MADGVPEDGWDMLQRLRSTRRQNRLRMLQEFTKLMRVLLQQAPVKLNDRNRGIRRLVERRRQDEIPV